MIGGGTAKEACAEVGNEILDAKGTQHRPTSSALTRHGKRKATFLISEMAEEVVESAELIKAQKKQREMHTCIAEMTLGQTPRKEKTKHPELNAIFNRVAQESMSRDRLLKTPDATPAEETARQGRMTIHRIRCFGQEQERQRDSLIAQAFADLRKNEIALEASQAPPLAITQ